MRLVNKLNILDMTRCQLQIKAVYLSETKIKNINSSQTFLTKDTFCQDLTYSLPTFFYFCVKEVIILRSHSVLT